MPTYYELMVIIQREEASIVNPPTLIKSCIHQEGFKDGNELDELALKGEIDSKSQTVATAIGIIRWLLENDESVKGKYLFKKKK